MSAGKAKKSGDRSALAGIDSPALAASAYAHELQRRAALVGFDWPDPQGAAAKIEEELEELRALLVDDAAPSEADAQTKEDIEEEVGDLMFAVINLARHLAVDPERALHRASGKFEARFRALERELEAQGRDIRRTEFAELDALWESVKKQLNARP